MVRKNLNGGGCGCGSSGLLGFPQAGGGCGCSGTGVLPQMGGKHSWRHPSMSQVPTNISSMPKMSENSASIPKTPRNTSSTNSQANTLTTQVSDHEARISALEQAPPSTTGNSSSSPGLFGGGIFDFLSPKKQLPPMPSVARPLSTLSQNQPPTLQEVVRNLQFRVKTLEDETRPSTVGGYKANKRNLNALKKYKQGKSIGFTMRSSLKAKGLIPRANGTRRVSKKYRG